MLPRIFEMFTQVEASADHSRGGLGIGLSLVKNLVQMHGGTVTATSEGSGKGREFVVSFPRAATLAIEPDVS
jgi:signal transduction histidine kinase